MDTSGGPRILNPARPMSEGHSPAEALPSVAAQGIVRGGRRQGFLITGAHHALPTVRDYRFATTGADRISRPQHHRRWPRLSLPGLRAGRLSNEAQLARDSLPAWRGRAR